MAYPQRKNLKEETRQKLVIVGSKNPIKISSTDVAFHAAFESAFIVNGINVGSGIEGASIGDQQTLSGAKKRAENAKIHFPEGDFWVGIEGGCEEFEGEISAFAWVVVLDQNGKMGRAKSSTFLLPKIHSNLNSGIEKGDVDAAALDKENLKSGIETVDLLTHGALNRKDFFKQAVVLALIPFLDEGDSII